MTDKQQQQQKKTPASKKADRLKTTIADVATTKNLFKLIYLHLWWESKAKKEGKKVRKMQVTEMRTKAKELEVKTERMTERVTQQSCGDERMLLLCDLSTDSIIII